MIARTWHGRVPRAKAEEYQRFLERTGIADYRATPGNRGVLVLRRDDETVTHFVLTSFWDSVAAIKRFAGEDYPRAHYYPEDDDYLLEREPLVQHHEVVADLRATAD
jgi:heme-degrading monooxygenase HmoA